MDFSVVVPSFNRAGLLPATLASIHEQNLRPAEIIVVDDGSTDDTCNLIQRDYPSVRYHRIANSGPGIARWTGMMLAKSDWIAFADSDDIWALNHLGSLGGIVRTFPDVDFIFSNFCNFQEDIGQPYYDHFKAAPEGWWDRQTLERDGNLRRLKGGTISDFLLFNPAWPSCSALHRSVLHKVGKTSPAVSRLPSEDGDLTRRLALRGKMACTFEKTVFIRKHGSNLSGDEIDNILGRAHILLFGIRDNTEIFMGIKEEILNAAKNDLLYAFKKSIWDRRWIESGHLYELITKAGINTVSFKEKIIGGVCSMSNPFTRLFLRPKFRVLLDLAAQNLDLWKAASPLGC